MLHDVPCDGTLKAAFQRCTGGDTGLNANDLTYMLLKYTGPSLKPRIAWCNEDPPQNPNVFTDGSYLHPGLSKAFGTFGSWDPTREIGLLTPEETDFSLPVEVNRKGRNSGLMLAGALPGVFNSSTRTELAGVISTLAKPGGLHIALDNLSVVEGITDIIASRTTSRRPWPLRTDGDLWSVAEEAIAARNPASITVSWTKGHAQWWHIIHGFVTERNAIGNGQADIAASLGHAAAQQQPSQAALTYHAKVHDEYVSIMQRLQAFAIAIMQADKVCRETKGFVPHGKHAPVELLDVPSAPIVRPPFDQGDRLHFLSVPRELQAKLAEVQVFWEITMWQPEGGSPTTWLEIFALYRYWGGGNKAHLDPHAPRPTFKSQLKDFVSNSKALFKVAGHPDTLQALASFSGKDTLLASYGIRSHLPAVTATLCIAHGINIIIHNMLIKIRQVKGSEGSVKLKASCLPLPRLEPWLDHIGKAPLTILSIILKAEARRHEAITIRGEHGDGRDLKPDLFFLNCPTCNSARNAAGCKLYDTKAKTLVCLSCRKGTTSTQWLCTHGIAWHKCGEHRAAGFRCGSQQGTRDPSSSSSSFKTPAMLAHIEHTRSKRIEKLGPLGSRSSSHAAPNSASCPRKGLNKNY